MPMTDVDKILKQAILSEIQRHEMKQSYDIEGVLSNQQSLLNQYFISLLIYMCYILFSGDLVACGVLSGNRNFEGRIHPLTRANYLASPLLVVAYALAGTVSIDFETTSLGKGSYHINV